MMAKLNELKLLRVSLGLSQGPMAKALGFSSQSYYSEMESKVGSDAWKKSFEKAKEIYKEQTGNEWLAGRVQSENDPDGVAEVSPSYVTGVLPRHVEEAFKLLMEVADQAKAELKDFDRAQVGRVLGIAAREIARAGGPEPVRQEVMHEMEVLLGLMR